MNDEDALKILIGKSRQIGQTNAIQDELYSRLPSNAEVTEMQLGDLAKKLRWVPPKMEGTGTCALGWNACLMVIAAHRTENGV